MTTSYKVKFFLGDQVSIIEPQITGTVISITLEGSKSEYITLYRVRYWVGGEMYEKNLTKEELSDVSKKNDIGFTNVKQEI